jgi:excisionase family DNA binding protein
MKRSRKQFTIAIQLVLEWVEQREHSIQITKNINIEEPFHNSRLLTAPDAAKILIISKGAAYQFIQQKKRLSVRINRNVRVRREDLDDFLAKHWKFSVSKNHKFTKN